VIDTHVKNLNDTRDRKMIRDYGRDNVLNQILIYNGQFKVTQDGTRYLDTL
jgi:hypothetical protein